LCGPRTSDEGGSGSRSSGRALQPLAQRVRPSSAVAVYSDRVSDRDARFRRLRPDGDLFAHFGIELEPSAAAVPTSTVAVAICSHCRWYVWRTAASCPLCGAAVPTAAGPRP